MRFVLMMTLATMCMFGLVLAFALVGNFDQAVAVQWWLVLLGPFAWFCTTFSGKSGNGLELIVIAAICVVFIGAEIRHDCFRWRIASALGILLWFLYGLSIALAWT